MSVALWSIAQPSCPYRHGGVSSSGGMIVNLWHSSAFLLPASAAHVALRLPNLVFSPEDYFPRVSRVAVVVSRQRGIGEYLGAPCEQRALGYGWTLSPALLNH